MWFKEKVKMRRDFIKDDFKEILRVILFLLKVRRNRVTLISYSIMYFSLESFCPQYDHRRKVNLEVQKYPSKANKLSFGEF